MRTFIALVFAILASACVALADDAPDAKPDQTITFTDGSKAISYFNCGDGDLCARIKGSDGAVLSIYSEGAALCQAYQLHFVKSDATGKTLFEFSRSVNHTEAAKLGGCGHTVATQMVMNRGYVHLNVSETPDGTLDLKFSAAK